MPLRPIPWNRPPRLCPFDHATSHSGTQLMGGRREWTWRKGYGGRNKGERKCRVRTGGQNKKEEAKADCGRRRGIRQIRGCLHQRRMSLSAKVWQISDDCAYTKELCRIFTGFGRKVKKARPNYCPTKKLRFLFPPPNSKAHLWGFLPPRSKKSGGNIDLSMAVTSISPPRRMNRIFRLPDPSSFPGKDRRGSNFGKRENLFSLFHALPPSRKEEAGRERRNIAVLSKETKNRKGKVP